ncbi:MAG: dihydrodipicolinate synthase family protein, partial [Pseudomonadota bacterium]
ELLRFFTSVVKVSEIPLGLQNAPQYLGAGLSDESLARLAREFDQFRYLKGEGSALAVGETIAATKGALAVFNGRGGLELPDNHRAGCAGLIPAPECADVQVKIWEAMDRGEETEAERLYAEILPLVTFLMQSVDQFLCYGKRITARRLGIAEVRDRAPAQAPTAAGLAAMARYSEGLAPY